MIKINLQKARVIAEKRRAEKLDSAVEKMAMMGKKTADVDFKAADDKAKKYKADIASAGTVEKLKALMVVGGF